MATAVVGKDSTSSSAQAKFEALRKREREKGELRHQLRQALDAVKGKFSYERLQGIARVRDAVASMEEAHDLLSSMRVSEELFERVLSSGAGKKKGGVITPVKLKEKTLALEALLVVHQCSPYNPHSKGFLEVVRLVVESAKPNLQLPALVYLRALLEGVQQQKSFEKSRVLPHLAKWWREQTLAAGALVDRQMSDVLQTAADIFKFLATQGIRAQEHRQQLTLVLGPENLAKIMQ